MSATQHTPALPETFLVAPSSLVEHPALGQLPPLDPAGEDAAQFLALVEDAGAIHTPVLVDEHDRLVDGRRRRYAAHKLGLPLLARRCRAADACSIIAEATVCSGRYDVGQMAYLIWPLIVPEVEGIKARQLENLCNQPSRVQPLHSRRTTTLAELAARWRISKRMLHYAREVHALFAEHPEAKATFGPRLLSGETPLQKVIDGWKGVTDSKGPTPKPVKSLNLGRQNFSLGWKHWEKIPEPEREEQTTAIVDLMATAPEEVRAAVYRRLRSLERTGQ